MPHHAFPSVGELAPGLRFAIQVAVSAWMVAVAVMDHRTGRIPNTLVGPVMLGVGAFRLVQAVLGAYVLFLMLVAWALIFVLWMLHFIGGGDAKFLMGLYALFPSMEFTAVLAFVLLVLTVPLVLLEMRGRSVGEMRQGLESRMITGQVMPTETELRERGRRYAWTFAIPGLLYTWIWWA
jgi:Flp pilus assembly protein protease CpaA